MTPKAPHIPAARRPRRTATLCASAFAALLAASPLAAAPDTRPYDDQLIRLAEILGTIHYLRELCSANDGQRWRDHMRVLLDAEGTSTLRKARLSRSFNQGYRGYSRTYTTCTPSAQTAIERFLVEGAEISETLVKRAR